MFGSGAEEITWDYYTSGWREEYSEERLSDQAESAAEWTCTFSTNTNHQVDDGASTATRHQRDEKAKERGERVGKLVQEFNRRDGLNGHYAENGRGKECVGYKEIGTEGSKPQEEISNQLDCGSNCLDNELCASDSTESPNLLNKSCFSLQSPDTYCRFEKEITDTYGKHDTDVPRDHEFIHADSWSTENDEMEWDGLMVFSKDWSPLDGYVDHRLRQIGSVTSQSSKSSYTTASETDYLECQRRLAMISVDRQIRCMNETRQGNEAPLQCKPTSGLERKLTSEHDLYKAPSYQHLDAQLSGKVKCEHWLRHDLTEQVYSNITHPRLLRLSRSHTEVTTQTENTVFSRLSFPDLSKLAQSESSVEGSDYLSADSSVDLYMSCSGSLYTSCWAHPVDNVIQLVTQGNIPSSRLLRPRDCRSYYHITAPSNPRLCVASRSGIPSLREINDVIDIASETERREYPANINQSGIPSLREINDVIDVASETERREYPANIKQCLKEKRSDSNLSFNPLCTQDADATILDAKACTKACVTLPRPSDVDGGVIGDKGEGEVAIPALSPNPAPQDVTSHGFGDTNGLL